MPDADVVVVEHDALLQDGLPHPRVVHLLVAVPEALGRKFNTLNMVYKGHRQMKCCICCLVWGVGGIHRTNGESVTSETVSAVDHR